VPWSEKKSPGYRDELIGESKRMAAAVVELPPEFRLIGSRKARAIVSPRTTRGLGRRRRHVGSQKLFKVFPFIALLSHYIYVVLRRGQIPPPRGALKPNSRVSNGRPGKKIPVRY